MLSPVQKNAAWVKKSVNQVANYMNEFERDLLFELPIFEENSKIRLDGLRHAAIFLSDLNNASLDKIEYTLQLNLSTIGALEGLLTALDKSTEAIDNQKRYTTKFNKSKKNLVSSLKKFKKVVEGLKEVSNGVDIDLKLLCRRTEN